MGVDYTNCDYQDKDYWGLSWRVAAIFIFSPQPIEYLGHWSFSFIKLKFIKSANIKF